MAIYALVFSDDECGLAKRLEFSADDLTSALITGHKEAIGRTAELWRDEIRLCTIRRHATLNPVMYHA